MAAECAATAPVLGLPQPDRVEKRGELGGVGKIDLGRQEQERQYHVAGAEKATATAAMHVERHIQRLTRPRRRRSCMPTEVMSCRVRPISARMASLS